VKTFSILLSIVLGLVSLSCVVWIGRFGGGVPKISDGLEKKPAPTVEDLPLPKSGPYGKAEIEESEFNFGTRLVGTNDEHTFPIRNVGEGELKFKLGKPSCQCTGVEVFKANGDLVPEGEGSLAPGESINVLIKWKMVARLEKFRHGAPLFTTDPEQRKIQLSITGMVDSPFHLSPEGVWDFGEMSSTEPSTAEGTLASSVYDHFTLLEEPRDNPQVKVTWETADAEAIRARGGKFGYKIKVEANPAVAVGLFRESIKLKAVGDPETDGQIIEFTVTGHRSGPIEVRGVVGGAGFNVNSNRLVFQDFPATSGKTVKMTVFVKHFDEELVLKSVEPDDTRYKVRLLEGGKTLGKSKSYQLEVEIPPGPPGKHRDEDGDVLILHLNHPEAPDFRLILDYNATR